LKLPEELKLFWLGLILLAPSVFLGSGLKPLYAFFSGTLRGRWRAVGALVELIGDLVALTWN